MTALIERITPAVSVTMICPAVGMGTILPCDPNRGVMASVTVDSDRRPNGKRTVTSSNLPRLANSSRLTVGINPSGIPSDNSTRASIRPRRISV